MDGTNIVVYRTRNNSLQVLRWKGTDLPETENITPADAPLALGDPAPFVNRKTGHDIVVYRGTDRHIHTLYWALADDPVLHDDLTDVAKAPTAAGDPVTYYTSHNDEHQVTYRGDDNHVYELWWQGIKPVRYWDVTAFAGAPPAASDPVAYYSAGTNTKHYVYRSADNHLHEIWVIPGGLPTHVDVTLEARAPLATDQPAAFVVAGPDTHHAVYRGTDGQIHEICSTSSASRIPPRVGVQSDWRWCNKCQGLVLRSAVRELDLPCRRHACFGRTKWQCGLQLVGRHRKPKPAERLAVVQQVQGAVLWSWFRGVQVPRWRRARAGGAERQRQLLSAP